MEKQTIVSGDIGQNISYEFYMKEGKVFFEYIGRLEGERAEGIFPLEEYNEGIIKLIKTGDCRIKSLEGELWIHTNGIGALLRYHGGKGNRISIINNELNILDLLVEKDYDKIAELLE